MPPNRQSLQHSSLLIFSILTVWLWSSTPALNLYNLQLTGALMLVYFASKLFLRASHNRRRFDLTSAVILSSICLLLIFSTGGLTSPLFFLLDFILIALALLFEPGQAIITSVLLVFLFLWSAPNNLNTEKIINLISLLLMTPIAIAFSQNYLENLKNRGRIHILEEVVQEEENESLLWISQAKPSIASVLNSTTDLVMYFNSKGRDLLLPPPILEKLKSIQGDLITLYTSTGTLEKTLEDEADKVRVS